jgi:hypothetical protein
MNLCRVHHLIIIIVTAVSIIVAANPVPITAQQEQFQSTVCNNGICNTVICSDNLSCQSFPPNGLSTVEPVPTGIVMEPIGQNNQPVTTGNGMEPKVQGEELIQPLEDEVAGTQAAIAEPPLEEGDQGQAVDDMLISEESQDLANPTTSAESGFGEANDHSPADLATSDQDTEVPVEVCEDGLNNDGDGEVDEECDGATSFSSTLPNDLIHETEHEEDHHEQFSEEYMRQHDGGDRAEFLQELNEKHDPPFYVPPTNS